MGLQSKCDFFCFLVITSTFSFDLTDDGRSYDCNGTGAQRWLIRRGSTKVRVANTNFCLDAGNGEPHSFFLS